MHTQHIIRRIHRKRVVFNALFVLGILSALIVGYVASRAQVSAVAPTFPTSINQAFNEANQRFGVPVVLLKAICYKEGRISQNAGVPSVDNGFGCMGLVKNSHADVLDSAAQDLGVNANQLKQSLSANIFGGAAILRANALQLSSNQTLPTNLADWYGTVAQYSQMTLHSTALLYANEVYAILKQGFSVQVGTETVVLAPQSITPNTTTAAHIHTASTLPGGCVNDGKTDYPGAIDCILSPPAIFDCNVPTSPNDCNYSSSDRPASCTIQTTVIQPCKIDQVVIHDTEGSLTSALDTFQCPGTGNTQCPQASVQYIIDTDGTVYQVLHEKDIAYHAGNFWYNEHSIGIEHVGFDATGFQWYNSSQYQASAKLTSYLLKKYHLPLDRAHVVAHGTVPAPFLAATPNHVDPGPYWLWDYYLELIHRQGVPFPAGGLKNQVITLHPNTDKRPFGRNGTETPANFNFFYLYNGPSTASGLIPQEGDGTDITDETNNVEPGMSYYYLAKVKDPAGTGDTMYEIWYGEEDHAHDPTNPTLFANAQLAWLAVPPGAATEGQGTLVKLTGTNENLPQISGRPTTGSLYYIGDAPDGAVFVSAYTLIEDGTTNLWYEVNYNHRQAWVPASEVTVVH